MRKWIAMAALLILVAALAACGSEAELSEDMVITRATEAAEEAEHVQADNAGEDDVIREYSFLAEGVELVPGADFDPAALPEAASVYTVPSCAIEGTDNVYNYETFEVTAFDYGSGEQIYLIYIIDPNITTPEGLALGDSLDRMLELYGDSYERAGSAYEYSGGNTLLSIIVQNDVVASIEYRMITG